MIDRIAHEPVHRVLETVAIEATLTAGQALLIGLCLAVAVAPGQVASITVVGSVLAAALGLGYGIWLLGAPGTLMAILNLPLLLLSVDAFLVAAGIIVLDPGTGDVLGPSLVGPVPPLLASCAAGLGLACGVLLPGPRRHRVERAHALTPVTASAHLSQGAVLERLRSAAVIPAGPPSQEHPVWIDESGEPVASGEPGPGDAWGGSAEWDERTADDAEGPRAAPHADLP
jgi:hypothetical protein